MVNNHTQLARIRRQLLHVQGRCVQCSQLAPGGRWRCPQCLGKDALNAERVRTRKAIAGGRGRDGQAAVEKEAKTSYQSPGTGG